MVCWIRSTDCAVPHLERFVERVFESLDVQLPSDFMIPVRVVEEPPCPASACYVPADRTVYLRDLDWVGSRPSDVLRHELTHAILERSWGDSNAFFSEGLTEALARSSNGSAALEPLMPVGEMLSDDSLAVSDDASAYFTRSLIDTRGLPLFKQVYQGAGGLSGHQVRALLESVYDRSFAPLEAEYSSGEPRCRYQLDLCDAETAELVGSRWNMTTTASCGESDVYGSAGADELTTATQRTLEVELSGTYRLHTFYDPPPLETEYLRSEIVLIRCGACSIQSVATYKQTDHELELEAGLYTLEVIMPYATEVTVDLERVP